MSVVTPDNQLPVGTRVYNVTINENSSNNFLLSEGVIVGAPRENEQFIDSRWIRIQKLDNNLLPNRYFMVPVVAFCGYNRWWTSINEAFEQYKKQISEELDRNLAKIKMICEHRANLATEERLVARSNAITPEAEREFRRNYEFTR